MPRNRHKQRAGQSALEPPAPPRGEETNRCSLVLGLVDTDGELNKYRDMHSDRAGTLLRYCQNALALVDSFNRIHVDFPTFSVQCRGKTAILGSTQEFRLMWALVESEGKYVAQETLAERLGNPELSHVKHIKLRLTKALGQAGMEFVADAIRAEPGHYGLFFS